MNQEKNKHQGEKKLDDIMDRLREARDNDVVSEERSREVVVLPNGEKVIKVRKRKRVYEDEKRESKKAAGFKKFILFFGIAIIFSCIVGVTFLMLRISSFNSEDFLKQKEQELSQAWGAQVELKDVKFEGLSFSVGLVKASFPDSSMLKEVTMSGISANLLPISFITGICRGDMMEVQQVQVVLRNKKDKFVMPEFQGSELWQYSRYRVPHFEIIFDDAKTAPFQLHTELYMRASEEGRYVCNFSTQTLQIRGWDQIKLSVASLYVTKTGIEYFDIEGKMGEDASVSLEGKIAEGDSYYKPFIKLTGENLPLSWMTNHEFAKLIDVNFGSYVEDEAERMVFMISLPKADQKFPPFSGEGKDMKKFTIQSLPILNELAMLTGNKLYLNALMQSSSARFESDGNGLMVNNIDAKEFSFLAIKGALNVSATGDLTGNLSLGIPYRTGMGENMNPDPLFIKTDSETSWVDVVLSGTLNKPMDNTYQLLIPVKPIREKLLEEQRMMRGVMATQLQQKRESQKEEKDEAKEKSSDQFESLLK
ncbi:MAG: hypothetical protein RR553_04080 [Akkermansia sp.]